MNYQPLFNFLEYLFPKTTSLSKKITDIKWIRKLVPNAPYLSIMLAIIILVWGIAAFDSNKFPINPQFIVFLGLAFWISLCLICAHFLKNKERSPAVPMLLSFFISIKGICTLLLFLAAQSQIKEMSKNLIQENTHFAQEIQSKIQERRVFINQKFQEHQSEFQKRLQKVEKSMTDLDRHFEGFKQTGKEMSEWMDARLARAEQETKEMDQVFWDSVHKRQAELEAERKKTPSFFNSQKQDETSSQEDAPSLDLPVICDGEKWLREHTKPEYLEESTNQK